MRLVLFGVFLGIAGLLGLPLLELRQLLFHFRVIFLELFKLLAADGLRIAGVVCPPSGRNKEQANNEYSDMNSVHGCSLEIGK